MPSPEFLRFTRACLALLPVLSLAAATTHAHSQIGSAPLEHPAAADSAAIRGAALDYIDGWYTGDTERMRRALHPDLAKRFVRRDAQGRYWLHHSTADALIRQTEAAMGTDIPPERRWRTVEILDIDGNLASVKLSSTRLVDYMHLARWDGGWRIVNVLWDGRPEDRPRP